MSDSLNCEEGKKWSEKIGIDLVKDLFESIAAKSELKSLRTELERLKVNHVLEIMGLKMEHVSEKMPSKAKKVMEKPNRC